MTSADQSPLWLDKFLDIYHQLDIDNLAMLAEIYHNDVQFQDPVHQLQGFSALHSYFQDLYQNLTSCRFVIDHVVFTERQAAVYWRMEYCHPDLNGHQPIEVEGHSLVKSNGEKVIYHRDYIDMGAMVYEHIPLLGWAVKKVKQRMVK